MARIGDTEAVIYATADMDDLRAAHAKYCTHPSPRNREHYVDPTWEAWKNKIYGIVDRQQARVEAERKKGIK